MKLLAQVIRPTKLDDIIGQEHLIGENKIITNLVKKKKIFSMILHGMPGCGKTSIANAIVNELDVKYRFLNATINSKKDFDEVIEIAKMYGELILVIEFTISSMIFYFYFFFQHLPFLTQFFFHLFFYLFFLPLYLL